VTLQAQAWARERLPALHLPPAAVLLRATIGPRRRQPRYASTPPPSTEGWESRARGSSRSLFPFFQGCHSG